MNAREANVLLTKISYRDQYPRWRSPEDQATAAQEWADDLADVPLNVALEAMREHYAVERRPLMIADIRDAVPLRDSSWAGNITEQRLAREALEAGQVTP